jgi:hypothetical protein
MGEEVITAENPQLAFTINNDKAAPIAEPPPDKPTDVSKERLAEISQAE